MKITPTMRVILNALEKSEPMTIPQICEHCKLNYRSLYNTKPNCLELLREAKLVRIVDWQRAEGKGGMPKAVYAFGPATEEEPQKPGKKSYKEKYEVYCRWRERTKPLAKVERKGIIATLLGIGR